MSTPDLDLLDRWRAGDEPSGQELFARHFESLYSFFETKCPAEADELVQTTFLECIRSRDKFRAHSSFRTFLFAIARHTLYHLFRTRQRKYAKLDFEVSSIEDIVTTMRTRLAQNEEQQLLLQTLQRLPVEVQTLLELHYWEDMDIPELAEVFEVTPGAMRTRLHRARATLRDTMLHTAPAGVLETLDTMDVWARGQRA
ncbi:MAG: sigma-70 family RNA polymerase sigma factor [Kofleriaceae bacterium]